MAAPSQPRSGRAGVDGGAGSLGAVPAAAPGTGESLGTAWADVGSPVGDGICAGARGVYAGPGDTAAAVVGVAIGEFDAAPEGEAEGGAGTQTPAGEGGGPPPLAGT